MTTSDETVVTIRLFNEALNRHDVDAVMDLMTEDVVFESTSGERFTGQEAVGDLWSRFFEAVQGGWFDTEDIFAMEDRCVATWVFTFDKEKPAAGHVRGVDDFRVRDDKVAEKLSYVKSASLAAIAQQAGSER
jgi:limonene-1,2-epoxide hydrolase